MTKSHPQILVVSWNELLLQTRRLILGTYFEVASAGKLSEAADRLRTSWFDLVILCDTLSDSECMTVFECVNSLSHKPEILLLLGPNQERPAEIAGHTMSFRRGPMDLLHECAAILGVEVGGKQRSGYPASGAHAEFAASREARNAKPM